MNNWTLRLSLTLIAVSFLTGCATGVTATGACPPPQYPDAAVGAELEGVEFAAHEHFWTWMARVEKLNQQLETCQPIEP